MIIAAVLVYLAVGFVMAWLIAQIFVVPSWVVALTVLLWPLLPVVVVLLIAKWVAGGSH